MDHKKLMSARRAAASAYVSECPSSGASASTRSSCPINQTTNDPLNNVRFFFVFIRLFDPDFGREIVLYEIVC